MTTTIEFRCKDCKEEFDHQINCKLHHIQTKHEKYEILATDHVMVIKS